MNNAQNNNNSLIVKVPQKIISSLIRLESYLIFLDQWYDRFLHRLLNNKLSHSDIHFDIGCKPANYLPSFKQL